MINVSVLSVTLALIAIYISVRLAIQSMSSNLEQIRSYTVMKLYEENGEMPLLDFLSVLEKEKDVLLFIPNRSNKPLFVTFVVFLIIAICGIFYPDKYSNGLINTIYISIYSISIGLVGFFLWYDFKYYEKFKKVQDKFPIPQSYESGDANSIIVRANKANSADAKSRAAD